MTQMDLFTKKKHTHRLREWAYGYWWEGWGKGIVREFGIDMYILLCVKWIKKQVSTVLAQVTLSSLCDSLGGRGVWGRVDTCICMAESLCCPETSTTLLIGYESESCSVLSDSW